MLDRLFPRQCIWCKQIGEYLCKSCKQDLSSHPDICPICHRDQYVDQIPGAVCASCRLTSNVWYEGIVIGFSYSWLLKKLIIQLKFGHRHDIASWIAHRLQYLILTHPILSQALAQDQLILTYVPSHRYRRYRIKGYNQSQLLAHHVSKLLWIPVISLTTKIKHTQSQLHASSRQQRLKNLTNAFALNAQQTLSWSETIVIIDDITTTGSTIQEISKTIKSDYPHARIRGLVVARNNQQ